MWRSRSAFSSVAARLLTFNIIIGVPLTRLKKVPHADGSTAGHHTTSSASTSVVKTNGRSRDQSGSAQIFGGRLARAAVRNNIEADTLPLIEGAHAGALDCADMYEDVLPAMAG
jgi:hypothetical protein